MTKTSIPFSAFHPKPRLKYRFNIFSVLGHITEWAKVTEGKKCLGWRPTNNAEFADSGMAELTAMEPLPRAFYFFHAVASAAHDRWTPSQAAEAWAFFHSYDEQNRVQTDKRNALEADWSTALAELMENRKQAEADLQELSKATAALAKAKAPKTVETRKAAHEAAEKKAKLSAEVLPGFEEKERKAFIAVHTAKEEVDALYTRVRRITPIMQRALDALRMTDAAYTQAA